MRPQDAVTPPVPQTPGGVSDGSVAVSRGTEGSRVEGCLQPVVSPPNSLEATESVVRRARRSTADDHPNIHHLPRALGVGSVSLCW